MSHADAPLQPELRATLAPALGKIASGLYIATVRVDGEPIGMLCSFVEQASFEPPMITLAIAPDRPIVPGLQPGHLFGLHVLGKSNTGLMKSFARGSSADSFAAHQLIENPHGIPHFSEAWAFLLARVTAVYPAGDHQLHLAEVVEGTLQREEEEPMVRVRANGFKY